jgi:hypothetical protein
MTRSGSHALIFIPACRPKRVAQSQHYTPPLARVQAERDWLVHLVQKMPALACHPENIRGVFNADAPVTQALALYVGQFCQTSRPVLHDLVIGRYPTVHILIV